MHEQDLPRDIKAFQRSVAMYCKDLETVAIGCRGAECEHSGGEENHQCEESFSREQCDSCGSCLAGARLDATGLWRDKGKLQSIEMVVCIDCAMYHANGELPEQWQG